MDRLHLPPLDGGAPLVAYSLSTSRSVLGSLLEYQTHLIPKQTTG